MFRPVIVSTAILFGLFLGADGAAGGSPNIPKTPKIMIPRPPAASRILVLPRTITVPRQDESTDDTNSKKKKKKKVAGSGKSLKKSKPADPRTAPSIDGTVTEIPSYTTPYYYYGEAPASGGPGTTIDGSVTVTAPYTTVYDYYGEPEAETKPAETPVSGGQRPRLAPPAPSRPSTGVFKIPVPQQAK